MRVKNCPSQFNFENPNAPFPSSRLTGKKLTGKAGRREVIFPLGSNLLLNKDGLSLEQIQIRLTLNFLTVLTDLPVSFLPVRREDGKGCLNSDPGEACHSSQ